MFGPRRATLIAGVSAMLLSGILFAACGSSKSDTGSTGVAAAGTPATTTSATATPESVIHRSIAVSGVGIVSVVPDTANASVGALVTDPSVTAALQQVDDRMNAVVKVLRDSGIPDENIKTIEYSVTVNYDYNNPARPVTGYTVSHMVRFSVSPPEKVGAVISAAVNAGANQVASVVFTTSDPSSATQQARSKAMNDALVRAQQLAQAANMQLGGPISIIEGTPVVPVEKATAGAGIGAGSAPIQTGLQQIEVDVTVTYEIK